jgi:hypothetical protein
MEWAADGEEQKLCQLTHPEKIHEYLRKWPGLFECSRANPGVLAMYAPQLTIPGFDDGFADVFDELMKPDRDDAYQMPGYGGSPETTDGKNPLCGELIAWRHPSFGNYANKEIAYSFVLAYNFHYSRRLYNGFECLTWLLTDRACWMPQRLRDVLIEGMRDRTHWWLTDIANSPNAFFDALFRLPRSRFKFTREVRSAVTDLVAEALQKLSVQESSTIIAERFIQGEFVEGFYSERDAILAGRRAKP